MKKVKNKPVVRNRSVKKNKVSGSVKPDLTDENRFTMISKDPYFKRKAKEFSSLLSELDGDQNLG